MHRAPFAGPPKSIEYETVTVPKTKVAKVALTVGGAWVLPGMTPEQLRASRQVMRDLQRRDEAKRDAAKAKNDLEAYIITAREQLGDDSPWVKVGRVKRACKCHGTSYVNNR